jgi:hypothetical protein
MTIENVRRNGRHPRKEKTQENLIYQTDCNANQIKSWNLMARNTVEYRENEEYAFKAIRMFEGDECNRTRELY